MSIFYYQLHGKYSNHQNRPLNTFEFLNYNVVSITDTSVWNSCEQEQVRRLRRHLPFMAQVSLEGTSKDSPQLRHISRRCLTDALLSGFFQDTRHTTSARCRILLWPPMEVSGIWNKEFTVRFLCLFYMSIMYQH